MKIKKINKTLICLVSALTITIPIVGLVVNENLKTSKITNNIQKNNLNSLDVFIGKLEEKYDGPNPWFKGVDGGVAVNEKSLEQANHWTKLQMDFISSDGVDFKDNNYKLDIGLSNTSSTDLNPDWMDVMVVDHFDDGKNLLNEDYSNTAFVQPGYKKWTFSDKGFDWNDKLKVRKFILGLTIWVPRKNLENKFLVVKTGAKKLNFKQGPNQDLSSRPYTDTFWNPSFRTTWEDGVDINVDSFKSKTELTLEIINTNNNVYSKDEDSLYNGKVIKANYSYKNNQEITEEPRIIYDFFYNDEKTGDKIIIQSGFSDTLDVTKQIAGKTIYCEVKDTANMYVTHERISDNGITIPQYINEFSPKAFAEIKEDKIILTANAEDIYWTKDLTIVWEKKNDKTDEWDPIRSPINSLNITDEVIKKVMLPLGSMGEYRARFIYHMGTMFEQSFPSNIVYLDGSEKQLLSKIVQKNIDLYNVELKLEPKFNSKVFLSEKHFWFKKTLDEENYKFFKTTEQPELLITKEGPKEEYICVSLYDNDIFSYSDSVIVNEKFSIDLDVVLNKDMKIKVEHVYYGEYTDKALIKYYLQKKNNELWDDIAPLELHGEEFDYSIQEEGTYRVISKYIDPTDVIPSNEIIVHFKTESPDQKPDIPDNKPNDPSNPPSQKPPVDDNEPGNPVPPENGDDGSLDTPDKIQGKRIDNRIILITTFIPLSLTIILIIISLTIYFIKNKDDANKNINSGIPLEVSSNDDNEENEDK